MPPPINLLPPEIAARARELRIFQGVLAAGGAIVVVLIVLTLLGNARVNRERDLLRQEQDRVAAVQAEVAQLQQFEQLQARADARRGTLAAALGGDIAWSKFLNDVALIMPENSWLVNLTLAGSPGTAANGVPAFGTVAFQGFVFDFPGLAGWLTRMTQIEGLTFVYLNNGQRQELEGQRVVSFGANASVTETLLSKRCQAGQRCP